MKKTALVIVLAGAIAFPALAGDVLSGGLSIGIGANRYLESAGITAIDLSLGVSLALLPIQIDDMAAGVSLRAAIGTTIPNENVVIGWYSLVPLLTLRFSDLSISVGYGPWALADLPEVYIYAPAVLLGFEGIEIGMIGPSVFIGFGL